MSDCEKETQDLTPAYEKFGLLPEYPLTKKEKQILEFIAEESTDFLSLCKGMDCKPSKLEEKLRKLTADGMVTVTETGAYCLTARAARYLSRGKEEKKNEKKFKKFLLSLNEEETDAFFQLCDRFQYVQNPEAMEENNR